MTYPTGPGPEMPPQNPNWPGGPMPGGPVPNPQMFYSQIPNPQMPYPPVATMVPPPPTASNPRTQRNLRLAGLVAGALVVLLVTFNTLPSAVAGGVRSAYPNVKAVISGATDGQMIQPGQTLQLSAANSTGNNLTYSWDFGLGVSSNQETVSHTFNDNNPTVVTLEVKDPLAESVQGHDSSTSITINVQYPGPTASFTITSTGTDGFGNTNIQFDGRGSTGNSIQNYTWQFSNGNADFGSLVIDSFPTGGSYTATLTVTDATGQTGSSTKSFNT